MILCLLNLLVRVHIAYVTNITTIVINIVIFYFHLILWLLLLLNLLLILLLILWADLNILLDISNCLIIRLLRWNRNIHIRYFWSIYYNLRKILIL